MYCKGYLLDGKFKVFINLTMIAWMMIPALKSEGRETGSGFHSTKTSFNSTNHHVRVRVGV